MQAQEQATFDPLKHPHEPLPWSREGVALELELPDRPSEVREIQPPAVHAQPQPAALPPLAIFSPQTEEILQSYFSRQGGLSQPSNFGAMCERAMRLAQASYPCPKCGSSGSSVITVEEYAARAAQLVEHEASAKARLRDVDERIAFAQAASERKELETQRDDLGRELAAARKDLGEAMATAAACKHCAGTGHTKPRKFGRGHGDNVMTAVWCPTCQGGGRVGRPDPWQIKRLVAELADMPGLTVDELVHVARMVGEALPREGRWPRALAILQRMSWGATLPAAEWDFGVTLHRRSAVRMLVAAMSDPCDRVGCSGGYVVPIDVRETGSSIAAGCGTGDHVGTAAQGELERILDRVRAENPLAAGVLEAYYGIDGNRWGATPRQRLWAVMPLTKPGATLAREAADRFEHDHPGMRLDACELLAREQDEDRKSALVNRRRRAMLDSGDKAARSLFEAARRAWTRAVVASGHDPRDSVRVWGHEMATRIELEERLGAGLETQLAALPDIRPLLHATTAEAIADFGGGIAAEVA
jgi:hypothetical protein